MQVLDRRASDPEWFKARNQMGQVLPFYFTIVTTSNTCTKTIGTQLWCHQTFYISSFELNLLQVGLVPSNYLQELSQFLTQDVGGRNGSEGPVTNIFTPIPFFSNPPISPVSLAGDQTIISFQRPQTAEQPMGTERRARRFRGSRGTTVQSGA